MDDLPNKANSAAKEVTILWQFNDTASTGHEEFIHVYSIFVGGVLF